MSSANAERTECILLVGLSEILNPRVKIENESGKSRRFLSYISEFLTHL